LDWGWVLNPEYASMAKLYVSLVGALLLVLVLVFIRGNRKLRAKSDEAWLFRAIVESSQEAISVATPEGRLVYVNPAHERLFKRPKVEALTLNYRDYYSEESRSILEDDLLPSLLNGGSWEGVCESLDGEGRRFPAWQRGDAIRDAQGKMRYCFGLLHDVSEETRTRDELRRSNRFMNILSASSQWLFRATTEQELLDQVCAVLMEAGDYRQAWVLFPDSAATPQGWRMMAGHRRGGGSAQPSVLLAGTAPGLAVCQASQPMVVQELVPDAASPGSWQAAAHGQGIRACALFPIVLPGQLHGVLGVDADRINPFDAREQAMLQELANDLAYGLQALRDRHDLVRTERVLRQTVGSLRALINSSPLAIVTLNLEGRVQTWNNAAEQMFGWTAEDVVGKPLPIIPPEDAAAVRQAWDEVLAGRCIVGAERRRLHQDGRFINTILSVAPVRNERGDIVTIMAMYTDVTEQKRLESQFHQAQKLQEIGQLAGGVAHDFNNLLTVIQGHANLLRPVVHQTGGDSHLEQILKATASAAALTAQLLAFSRRQVLQPRVLDLNGVVHDMEKMLKRLLGETIQLAVCLDGKLRPVKVDPGQMQQVLLNLTVNARDAMPEGGQLTIETANVHLDATAAARHAEIAPGRYVMLAVTDTGVGMSAEVRARLFEPFFTTKDSGRGTGLGLAVVYGIIKQSSGHLWVYSEPGRGTTFKVFFPLASGPIETEEADIGPGDDAMPASALGGNVLLVEDDPSVRLLLVTMLEQAKFHVTAAESPAEACELADRHQGPLHLLLTDVILPGMNGHELARRLAPGRPDTRVLYISGYTGNAIAHYGVLDTETAFLQKPFSASMLSQTVRRVLAAPPGHFQLPVT
jgi:PAS domain S-box-containing protein